MTIRGAARQALVFGGLVSGCRLAPGEPDIYRLWAGGGFGCLEHNGAFDCRLLDDYVVDRGQADFPTAPIQAVSFGADDTCVLFADKTGSCFGENHNHNNEVPGGTWAELDQGEGQSCGRRADGSVECWGNGAVGYTPASGPFVELETLGMGACGRTAEGEIRCWGYDYRGGVRSPEGRWASFILPNSFLCMLDDEGRITCAGNNAPPQGPIPEGGGYHHLVGGYRHVCVLDDTNRAHCWGEAGYGADVAPDGTFIDLAAGHYFTCGLREDHSVECWGCREEGSGGDPQQYCNWNNPAPWWDP